MTHTQLTGDIAAVLQQRCLRGGQKGVGLRQTVRMVGWVAGLV